MSTDSEKKSRVMTKMKNEGFENGVPDVAVLVACQGFHGLFIEFKTRKGKVRTEQADWIGRIRKAGYAAFVVRSTDIGIRLVDNWMRLANELYNKEARIFLSSFNNRKEVQNAETQEVQNEGSKGSTSGGKVVADGNVRRSKV